MTLRYAVLREQDQTFAIVLVQKHILNDQTIAEQAIDWLQTRHFHMPTALMARDARGIPSSYYGRSDLALLLARVPVTAIEWQEAAIGK